MQVFDLTVTLTGTAIPLSSVTGVPPRFFKIRVTPTAGNSAGISVLGPNGNQIKFIANPSGAAQQDEFDMQIADSYNRMEPADFKFNGTNNDVANVSLFVG